jgi:hypothetical protein
LPNPTTFGWYVPLHLEVSFDTFQLCLLSECQTNVNPEHEPRLVSWIVDIVEEGRASGDDDFWPRPPNPSDCAYLGFAVVKLWARLIRGNEQWPLLKVIGDALDIYADACEGGFIGAQAVASGSV